MTQPRLNRPGSFMITRRATQRTFLFRPSSQVNDLYVYLLAVLSQKYGIEVHAAVLMSSHEHVIISDPQARRSDFMQEFHRLLANCLNNMIGWSGEVFDGAKPSVVALSTPEAMVEKTAYLMANPVEAGLVFHARDWPGVQTTPAQLGVARWTAQRPGVYLDPDNPHWPRRATLSLRHPETSHMAPEDFRAQVQDALQQREQAAREKLRAEGRRFAGRKAVLKTSRYKRATSWEERGSLNPHFATGRNQGEAYRLAARTLRAFRQAYHEALALWVQGYREVVFPAGTLKMHTLHQARVAPG